MVGRGTLGIPASSLLYDLLLLLCFINLTVREFTDLWFYDDYACCSWVQEAAPLRLASKTNASHIVLCEQQDFSTECLLSQEAKEFRVIPDKKRCLCSFPQQKSFQKP